eukprot:Selendium_serpulae@DN3910_c0_g1_i1.p1
MKHDDPHSNGATLVMVSGCYDMLHSGHIQFLREARKKGTRLIVALGSDRTITKLKGRPPVVPEDERKFLVENVKSVDVVAISEGDGILDFEEVFMLHKPDIFVVNEEGDTAMKRLLVESRGTKYVVLPRLPQPGLTPRSTTDLRTLDLMPYRVDLAGGWLDQPRVSKLCSGSVITLSLEPNEQLNTRSGMASSTRKTATDLWGPRLPNTSDSPKPTGVDKSERLAKLLFCYDNPPGTSDVSGSQDAIGIVYAGLAKSNYHGEYWPTTIDRLRDGNTLEMIESSLRLLPLSERKSDFKVYEETDITAENAAALARAAEDCWTALKAKDLSGFGVAVRASFDAQVAMFPRMLTPEVTQAIEKHRSSVYGWKLAGAGGGGYLVLVCDHDVDIPLSLRVVARRDAE